MNETCSQVNIKVRETEFECANQAMNLWWDILTHFGKQNLMNCYILIILKLIFYMRYCFKDYSSESQTNNAAASTKISNTEILKTQIPLKKDICWRQVP